ncbi:MAG: zinc ribbon domain-containing protein [Syntrophomonas sp.]|nr:zinc ribbon domain-containing protein [Syntrophomonas sp.]
MPVFEFRCQECGYKFDLMISNADKEKVQCPECGTRSIKQLLSSFNTAKFGGAPANDCAGCKVNGSGG